MLTQLFTPASFTTFGDLLKYLRRREHLTQLELSITVGYSEAQIGRLEKNQRRPDLTALKALFIPALHLEGEAELIARFLELAKSARQEDAPTPGYAPYKGLLFFDEADADLFFGREVLTAHLAERVADLASDAFTRLLAVVGASGSGKSSLVRAGLVVALKRAGWDVNILTPTENPLKALTTAIESFDKKSAGPALILIDQFEETFTLCRDESERIIFIEKLLNIAQEPANKIFVIITLRADFYSHCAQYQLLRQAVAAEQEYIGQMTAIELRRAIEEPAKRGGWDFEAGLVDVLLQDVGAQGTSEPEPGALPLLSHALLATWERRRGKTFTLEGYRASGGVRSAIAETAESVFTDQLNQQQQELARDVFLRLTELGEGTEDTRRRATLNELVRQSAEATQLRTVLNTLAEARLITLNEDSAEVAHEALIREWQRLHEWLANDRDGLRLHRHLTESAREWETRSRDTGELYRGARLAQAREWFTQNEERLNESERAFLAASIDQEQHDALEREAQRQRELESARKLAETQKRAAARSRRMSIVLLGSLVIAILLAGFVYRLNRLATSRELASASISNLDADPERSILLALQAEKVADTIEAQNALHRSILASRVLVTLRGHTAKIWSVAYSPDGKRIATASDDKTVKIWATDTGELLLTLSGHTGSVSGVIFSPNGKIIATASDDHTAKVWDAGTGKEMFTLSGQTDVVYRVAFSPDGKKLVTVSNDKTAKVWDATTGKELLTYTGHDAPVLDAAFSPDGKRIATCAEDEEVKIWDSGSGTELVTLTPDDVMGVCGIAFSQDGSRVAVAKDGQYIVRMWDANTGQDLLKTNLDISNMLFDIAFSPDGNLAAVSGLDRKVKIWDVTTGQVRLTLSGHEGAVNGIAFSPDGNHLATASWDGSARIWDLTPAKEALYIPIPAFTWSMRPSYSPDGTKILTDYGDISARTWDAVTGKGLVTFDGHSEYTYPTAFSADGKMVAGGSDDKSVIVWDAKSGRQIVTLSGHTAFVPSVAFSPDGTQLVSGSGDKTAIIWDLTSGKPLFTLTGHTDEIPMVVFSPDGKRVVTASADGDAMIWDAANGTKILTLSGHTDVVWGVAYSLDGKRIATASRDGTTKIWDASTGNELLTLSGHTGTVVAVSFNPGGNLVATASIDGTAKVWDTATGDNLLTLPVESIGAGGVAFSPDGKYLAVGGRSGVYIFVLPIEDLLSLAKSRVTRTLTTEECQKYLHVETCPANP